jgi:hypothetical protein
MEGRATTFLISKEGGGMKRTSYPPCDCPIRQKCACAIPVENWTFKDKVPHGFDLNLEVLSTLDICRQ